MGMPCQADGILRPGRASNAGLECLVFTLGGAAYGIDFLDIREIRGCEGVLPVPGAPGYLKGILNLRGALVPVIDLRLRFGLRTLRYDHLTDILVLETGAGLGGIIVDSVSQVAELRPVPADLNDPTAFITGVASLEGCAVGIVDVRSVFAGLPANPQACQVG